MQTLYNFFSQPLVVCGVFIAICFALVVFWDKKARKERMWRERNQYPTTNGKIYRSWKDSITDKK